MLEPGDPEWAFDLASVYTLALVRSAEPNSTADTKRLAAAILAELEKSDDSAVIGWTGAALYQGRLKAREPISESLLRRAAVLNPTNPAWVRALSAAAPTNATEFGAALTAMLQESDLWPRGVAPAMPIPPGAVRISAEALVAERTAGGAKQIEALRPSGLVLVRP